ncbi:hypothetical protein BHE74_00049907 [Ensete ventricosum]|nr:hypothetical protein BHE74_00049907 [Ensete ventricosum]
MLPTTYVSVDKRFGPPTRYWTVLILLSVDFAHPRPRVSSAGSSSSPRRATSDYKGQIPKPSSSPSHILVFALPSQESGIQISWETACFRSRFDRSPRSWRLSCSSPREPPDRLPVLFGLLVAIMWMFKSFAGKEPASLEGRTIDIGNVKVHVRNAIAEGGFSCIYVATDVVQPSKQYALKHVICNDDDLLDLITKEISVMKLLRGHPNVVALVAHTILDMGRRKEALLVMEFCEKSLATSLENRGSGYFEEKQVLLIFRDVCNAVYFMHSQSPPVAHRDLKAENVLLGPDGAWKLCDFGSTSTNHKCFDKSEEMGIEEDNIRKYTTPAYRAPEV